MALAGPNLSNKEQRILNENFSISNIYMAEVMDTRSPRKNGEIKVWLMNTNTDRNLEKNWYTAKYCSPFYGTTQFYATLPNSSKNPTAFGNWAPLPCVGNYVFVFFAVIPGGKVTPYWFGSPVDDYMIQTIPSIPRDLTGETDKIAICEKNLKVDVKSRRDNIVDYDPLTKALQKQGIDKDKLRGPSVSTAKREAPSMVYGMTTPLGNQFVMDDGWSYDDNTKSWDEDNTLESRLMMKNNLTFDKQPWDSNLTTIESDDLTGKFKRFNGGFRFRTRNGTQLLVLDSGNIYIINADGSAWTEWSDDGNIDVYSDKNVSISCGKDLNLKAGGNINMEAGANVQFKSEGRLVIQANSTTDIFTGTVNIKGNLYSDSLAVKTGIVDNFTSTNGQITGIFKGSLEGVATFATTAGQTYTKQPDPSTDEVSSPKVKPPRLNTIPAQGEGGTQESITTRAPTHEPYDGHNKNNCIPDFKKIAKVQNGVSKKISNTI